MAESKSKKTEAAKKIVDVKSGGDGSTGTSRPVIVTNRPILKDPMMAEISQLTGGVLEDSQTPTPTGDTTSENPSGAPEIKVTKKVPIKVDQDKPAESETADAEPKLAEPPSKKKLVIKPLDDKVSKKPEAKEESDAKAPTIAELAMPDADEVPDVPDVPTEPTEPAKADETEKAEEPAATEPPAEAEPTKTGGSEAAASGVQPGRSFDETEQAAKDAASPQPGAEQIELDAKGKPKDKVNKSGELTSEQQKAIEHGEYFLPITTAETRRLRREILFATLFVIVLIVVWLDIMLDAGLLNLGGVKAITDFF